MSPTKPDFSGYSSAQNIYRQSLISSSENGLPLIAIALDIKKLTFVALSEL